MKLNALLVSRDSGALQRLCAALDRLKLSQDVCTNIPDALELLAINRYSALIVDFDLPGAAHMVRVARMAPPQRRPVVFALLSLHADIGETFQSGANFVLSKPLIADQMVRCLRAGRAFMRPDRRSAARHKTESLVYLRFGDLCPTPAIVLDLNERGLSVQAAEPLPPTRIPLRFILPGTEYLIEGRGDVIWADEDGRAGILFTELPEASRKQLGLWIAKRVKSSKRPHAHMKSGKTRQPAARLS